MIEMKARSWEHPVDSSRAKRSPYKSGWSTIVAALRGELLKVRADRVVIEMDVRQSDIRNDGWIRSDARPSLPGVRLSFSCSYGDLTYECGTWTNWEHNLLAIARTLRAQRMIARDGAVKGDQIYRGFKALPGGTGTTSNVPNFIHWKILCEVAGVSPPMACPNDKELVKKVYREAARRAHPDSGGSAEQMAKVNRSRDALEQAGMA